MELGDKIAALRKTHGMTQAELGAELNVTFQAVSKWERDESLPDFATVSKMAKLFGVALEYFADDTDGADGNPPIATAENAVAADGADAQNGEVNANDEQCATAENAAAPIEPKMLGVCTKCGRVVYEGQQSGVTKALVCKTCYERVRETVVKKREEEAKKRAEETKKKQARAAARKAEIASRRNKGFIVGGIIAAVSLLVCIVSTALSDARGGLFALEIVSCILSPYMWFAFVSQLFWGGVVRRVCATGGAVIGTPGVIFSLDFDGVVFLIAAKIFFALLRALVFCITSLFFVLVGFVIAPFTFIPRLAHVIKGEIE